MCKIFRIYKKHMIKPIIYQIITKASIVLAISLIWEEYRNTDIPISLIGYAFPIFGVILIAFSWFQYIALDGFNFHFFNEEKHVKKKKNFHMKAMIDFTEERIEAFDELEKDEQIACKLASNLLTGLLYILISVLVQML